MREQNITPVTLAGVAEVAQGEKKTASKVAQPASMRKERIKQNGPEPPEPPRSLPWPSTTI